MEDMAPALLERLQALFENNLSTSRAGALLEKIAAGKAGYVDAGDYAEEVGRALADAFAFITEADLPDGRMYWNIADRVVRPLLEEDHALVSGAAVRVQHTLNAAAGLGLKAQAAPLDEDRVAGLLNSLAAAPRYDDVANLLNEPVITFSRAVVDETVRRNVEFQGKAGLRPRVIRRTAGGCCDWCRQKAGVYTYPGVPGDVFQRHGSCRCVVEYDPGTGRRQNVHTKQWTEPGEDATILERRLIGLGVHGTTIRKVSDHVRDRMVERSVPVEDILDAVEHPLQIKETKYDKDGRPSFTVVGGKSTVAINPETGVIVTCYPTHSKIRKKLEALKNEN